jgi:acyl-CoA reductase-like NAD-dependent aldehyde dehydrogenase
MNIFPVYIGGEFIETAQPLQVNNPFNNQLVAQTFLCGPAEIEIAIQAALRVKDELKYMPHYKRYTILMEIASSLKEQRSEFAGLLAAEAAKPLKLALGEVDRAIQTFVVAAEESRRIPGEYLSIDWTPQGEGKEALVKYFPIGLVAGIAPFNFPLNLAVHKIAPAIAAGCPIVLKPASSTPLSTLFLARIIHNTSLPKGAVSILPCNRSAGNQLVTDDRFGLLSFTGSPEVGWTMKSNAGKKKVVLELGGNAGVIVSASANLDVAVKKCVSGAFSYQGQVCIHTQRILVDRTVFDEFSHKFCEQTRQLKAGDPLNSETDFSSMIDEENAMRVEQWVNEAIESGAVLLAGGKRSGSFIEPTVLSHSEPGMKVCCLEVFGPVVTLDSFDHFAEAIDRINDSRFGLQAGVITNRLDEMNLAFDKIETGGVMINEIPTFRVDHMPYGGIKDSGLGREGVRYAMMDMLEPKILVKDVL